MNISQEAWGLARHLVICTHAIVNNADAVLADALQKLMDERDQFRASRDVAERAYKAAMERAEAAEKECTDADTQRSGWQRRAEAAEKTASEARTKAANAMHLENNAQLTANSLAWQHRAEAAEKDYLELEDAYAKEVLAKLEATARAEAAETKAAAWEKLGNEQCAELHIRAEAAEKERDEMRAAFRTATNNSYVSFRARAEAAEKNLAAFRHDKDVLVSQLEKRAEAAEKRASDVYELGRQAAQRANAAEARAAALSQDVNNVHGDAQRFAELARAAEARLAECVREVRECLRLYNSVPLEVLDKYSTFAAAPSPAVPDKAEHPDTVRLAECVREVREWVYYNRNDIDGYERDLCEGILRKYAIDDLPEKSGSDDK